MDGIRLCFQAVINKHSLAVVSNAVMKQKANAELNIFDVSRISSPASGDEIILLFCDKVNRKDIGIRFYERNATGDGNCWQHEVDPMTVHHQVGIKFKTPPYKTTKIDSSVAVQFELFLKSSPDKTSNAIEFEYVPSQMGEFFVICQLYKLLLLDADDNLFFFLFI